MTESKHRKEAGEIAKRYTREGTGYADRLYQLAYAIEQALSSRDTEVREVLKGLATKIFGYGLCWCPSAESAASSGEHTPGCLATRVLYEKVQSA